MCSALLLVSQTQGETNLSCNSLYTPAQRELCRNIPDLLGILQTSEQQARIQCERVFFNQPWNCSNFSVITPSVVMEYATKEAAYMYSIMSASIAYTTAGLCASDQPHSLPCNCSTNNMTFEHHSAQIHSGCSFDIDYGVELSEQFMDSFGIFSSDLEKFSLHNNRAGRLAVQNSTVVSCRCHGIFGSCTQQTCHLELETMGVVADRLFELYKDSCKVYSNGKLGVHFQYESDCDQLLETDLIYFVDSPDYCVRDTSKGSPGVQGRSCNALIEGEGSCSDICCGRGYEVVTEQFREPCSCRFVWCCEYVCEWCQWDETFYFCL